ncbi:MAG: AtpZ/AtpI family protein, partial [Clostridia bacterium]|nr:AtpZ/AtpI family protein [Clostridia bacterium]
SFIMPMLICMLICYLLSSKFGLDSWIYVVGILFGLGASCMTAYKFYRIEKEKGIKETRKISASNRHK